MNKYIDYEMCKQCGGVCCKQCGCIYLPKDIKNFEFVNLRRLIDKGNISISGEPFSGFYGDAWSFLLYLRTRNQNADIVDLVSTYAPCKLLTDEGCSLDAAHRPSLGLLVKPTVIGGPCEKMYRSDKVLEEWLKYSKVLTQLVEYYTNEDVIDVIIRQTFETLTKINDKLGRKEELKETEKAVVYWYHEIMDNKPYYTSEEVKILKKGIYL